MPVEEEIGKAAKMVERAAKLHDCPFTDAEIAYARRFIRRGMQLDTTIEFMRWSFHLGKWWVAGFALLWNRWDQILELVARWSR